MPQSFGLLLKVDPAMDHNARYKRSSSIISREVSGEVVLVPIRHKAKDIKGIFALNPMAARIWELLDGARSLSELKDQIVAEYDVQPQTAERDLLGLVEQLSAKGLVDEIT